MALVEDVEREFRDSGFALESKAVAESCASLCSSLEVDPKSLASSWELFYLNKGLKVSTLTSKLLDGFTQQVQNDLRTERAKQKQADFHFYTQEDLLDPPESDPATATWDAAIQQTPQAAGPQQAATGVPSPDAASTPPEPRADSTPGGADFSVLTPAPPSTFSKRGSRRTRLQVFNEHLADQDVTEGDPMDVDDPKQVAARELRGCALACIGNGPASDCRYLFDRVEDRADAIEHRIRQFGGALLLHEGCSPDALRPVYSASQDPVLVVGRVCSEGDGRLNDKSVLLEGSQEHSNGDRVKLDLRNIDSFSLFPGQVIGVYGNNPTGHCLVASRLITSLPPHHLINDPAPTVKPRPITRPTSALKIMVASGPFSTSENLRFEPLDELLVLARERRPDVLVLVGPFVDADHPQVRSGTMAVAPLELFQREIRNQVELYCEDMGPNAKVVLVPSTRDVHHDLVFPQPSFPKDDFEDPRGQILLLSNPGVFAANGVTVATTSMDILKHLSGEEVARLPAAKGQAHDRMARLASHLIGQGSFYPLFPATLGTCLDLHVAPDALKLPIIPDLLLLPSDLTPFIKELAVRAGKAGPAAKENGDSSDTEGVLQPICMNPGRLSKGASGGTFLQLTVLSREDQGEARGAAVSSVTSHTMAEIIRI